MPETGIDRAANLHLGGLPNFTLPSEASGRYFEQDLTEPITMTDDGLIAIPAPK